MEGQKNKKSKRITVIDKQKHRVPYSKGLTASAIMASGVQPPRAYRIAEDIEKFLLDQGIDQIQDSQLHQLIYENILEKMGERYASNYQKYHSFSRLDKPLIILIGGSTGVGKSTIATMLANRLGIVRIVSTDAVREVMRAFFSDVLMPAIHTSSFDAANALRQPLPESIDPIIAGFREQTISVLVGVRALINRAITEGTHVIIEGAHIVPGFIDLNEFPNAFIVQLVIAVTDESLHRDHLYVRSIETQGTRPFLRYIKHFKSIRKIQEYIIEEAKKKDIMIIDSVNLDVTISEVLQYIINEVYELEAKERSALYDVSGVFKVD